MQDVMKMAQTRRQDLYDTIAEREAEIVAMKGEISQLDTFLEIGTDLIDGKALRPDQADDVFQAEVEVYDEPIETPEIRDESDLQAAKSIRQIMPLQKPGDNDLGPEYDLYEQQ